MVRSTCPAPNLGQTSPQASGECSLSSPQGETRLQRAGAALVCVRDAMGQLWPVAGPFRSVLHIIAAVQAASAHGLCSCLLPDVGDRILAAQKE